MKSVTGGVTDQRRALVIQPMRRLEFLQMGKKYVKRILLQPCLQQTPGRRLQLWYSLGIAN